MAPNSRQFLGEMLKLVERKHSKNHPLFGLIEGGNLDKAQLQGFVKQFYLLFPKPFPKPIAAMLGRCPDDPELERMWIENVMEEASGEETGPVSRPSLSKGVRQAPMMPLMAGSSMAFSPDRQAESVARATHALHPRRAPHWRCA